MARPGQEQPLPFLTRLRYFLQLWLAKTFFTLFVWKETKRTKQPIEQRPTCVKTYSIRPNLPCHVFIPPSLKSDDAKIPLYVAIHGGAFIGGHPSALDADAAYLAKTFSVCVVIITYNFAPKHKFPTAPHDCAALIRAILADESLPIDLSRVAITGESAGGNLCLSCVQLDGLYKDVSAVVAYCPGTNFYMPRSEKIARSIAKPGTIDRLTAFLPVIEYALFPASVDRKDPLLSPHFADRGKLPAAVYVTGYEYDVLYPEAQDAAERYAEFERGEKVVDTSGEGWSKGSVRWRKVLGEVHGFNSYAERNKDETERARLIAKRNEMYADVFQWLRETAWKP